MNQVRFRCGVVLVVARGARFSFGAGRVRTRATQMQGLQPVGGGPVKMEEQKPKPNPLPSKAPDVALLTPPSALAEVKLVVMKEKPREASWSMAHAGFGDQHVQSLCETLHASECGLTALDLSFNKLTDVGLFSLCEHLAREGLAAHMLTSIRFGGNPVTTEAQAVVSELFKRKRPDVALDFEPTLVKPTVLLQVGKVFPGSPAADAGLRRDDSIVALGTFNFAGRERNRGFKSEPERLMDNIEFFRGVADSLKPLVEAKAKTGDGIDIVVQRVVEGNASFLALKLAPGTWSGEGLLGAKMGPPS